MKNSSKIHNNVGKQDRVGLLNETRVVDDFIDLVHQRQSC